MSPARFEARMDTLLSFPVGLFHPLQHVGLSRRTPSRRHNWPSVRAPALSSKKRRQIPLGTGRAVKGARRAFISTLDSSPRAP